MNPLNGGIPEIAIAAIRKSNGRLRHLLDQTTQMIDMKTYVLPGKHFRRYKTKAI